MKKTFFLILSCIFIILIIYSGSKIIKYYLDNRNNKQLIEETSKYIRTNKYLKSDDGNNTNNNEYEVDFEKLKQINPDIVGFLKVDGTNIEHLVVQTDNNDYYLYHNIEKKKNSSGWIFTDYRNKLDGTDKNIIIYGHNMRNGSMFSNLKNSITEEWEKNSKNHYITFITENENSIYEIISVKQVKSDEIYDLNDSNIILKNNENITYKDSERFLTLYTCADNTKYRVIIYAKRIESIN